MATLKCLNCDQLSPPGSASCIHCGRATLYARDKGRQASPGQEATNRMSGALLFIAIGWVVFWLCWSQGAEHRQLYARCTASTTALLSPAYTQVKTTKLGITVSTNYKVAYTFRAMGQEFAAQALIRREPKAVAMLVFFNPADPTESYLEKQAVWPIAAAFVFALVMTGLAVLMLRGNRQRPT